MPPKKSSRKSRPSRSVSSLRTERRPPSSRRPAFVVAMGGSAGALEAFEQFFTHMPADSGCAFVIITHMDPTHKGMLPELLGRCTPMEVVQAEESMPLARNRVYVIPPNKDMSVLHGALHLHEPLAPRGARTPIDFFFRHLAEDQEDRAV